MTTSPNPSFMSTPKRMCRLTEQASARPALPTHSHTIGRLVFWLHRPPNSSRYGAALRPRTSPDGLAALNEDRSSTRNRLPPTSQQANCFRDSLVTTHSLGLHGRCYTVSLSL